MTIVFASHWAIILTAVNAHVGNSIQQNWILSRGFCPPDIASSTSRTLRIHGLTPYWLSRHTAVPNNISMSGLFLLTAPNMSGKSTLMRAILTAALLGNCGLYLPATDAVIPRYDNFFLRSASYDIPKEGKSAFALEMDDVRVLLRDCTNKSLVMLDEIGKGTSARDGSALAGALLEHLDQAGVSGVFATHLHELFRLPALKLSGNTRRKKMGVNFDNNGEMLADVIHITRARVLMFLCVVLRSTELDISIGRWRMYE
jgi:DNA mismatch repair ATPase MutS